MTPPVQRLAPGRPRDPAIDEAVLQAALELLDADGYAQLSVEGVARAAGTTKPALYRRWSSRPHLVLAALATRIEGVRPPDTGCTVCDLDECLKVYVGAFRRMPPGVLGSLYSDSAAEPELRDRFMEMLFDPPRDAVKTTLERACERGDLREDIDIDLIVDLIGSLVHYRVLFGHARLSDEEIEAAVRTLLQGIAVDYAALVEHSRGLRGAPQLHHLHADSD